MENVLFSEYTIRPQVDICIVIPVKNEEKYIKNTLNAFLNQVDSKGYSFNTENVEILILANNCTDKSVKLIQEFRSQNSSLTINLNEIELEPHQANIGYVRRILMDNAYRRLSKNNGGIIMTTDADTIVSKDWISQNLCEVQKGADAVGGRILLAPQEIQDLDAETYACHIKDEKYHLLVAKLEAIIVNDPYDPLPRHHQHFNGSFAITSDCYLRSGGVPAVTHLEDIALFERLELIDAKVRHSNNVVVYTSARCIGRTEIGLSYQLNVWKNLGRNGTNFLVESFEAVSEKLILKKQMADLWEKKKDLTQSQFNLEFQNIIAQNQVSPQNYKAFKNFKYFGEWYVNVLEKYQNCIGNYPPEEVDAVILKLEHAVSNFLTYNFSQTSIR